MTGPGLHIPTLETERLILRAPVRADFDAYAAFYLSPRSGATAPTRRGAWKAFAKEVADWCLSGIGHWTLDLKGGPSVGFVGLSWPDYYPEPEMGWALYDGHEGRGFASEAARAMRDWARGRVGSLVSYTYASNTRSVAVAERIGAWRDDTAARPDGTGHEPVIVYRHWGAA